MLKPDTKIWRVSNCMVTGFANIGLPLFVLRNLKDRPADSSLEYLVWKQIETLNV